MWKIYFNPKCSKCRETMAIFASQGIEPEIIQYLENAPSKDELLYIISRLDGPASQIVRTKEEKYLSLRFDLTDPFVIASNLEKYPELLERPIVVHDTKAIVARPAERVRELF